MGRRKESEFWQEALREALAAMLLNDLLIWNLPSNGRNQAFMYYLRRIAKGVNFTLKTFVWKEAIYIIRVE